MKFYQSIRFRIVSSILLFGVFLVVLNSGITFFLMGQGFSSLVQNLLSTEAEYFTLRYAQDKTIPLPHSKYIKVFKGVSNVPDFFREQVKGLTPGIHNISKENSKRPMHVAVLSLPDTNIPYFMFFHGREFMKDNNAVRPHDIVFISLLILLIPGTIIGYVTSRMVYSPVVSLMEKIKGLNPEKIPDQLSDKHYSNEIGVLTRTIEDTMNRIKEFIEREKQFTRDASHELRTPLTIIKGATEIMEQQPETLTNPLLKKPLNRISQSINDMETTIETFLWLAREDSLPTGECHVEKVVRKAVDNNRYLIENKDIVVHIDVRQDIILKVKEEIFHIAVTNLIKNAFQFTIKGKVSIIIDNAFVEIRDTGIGIDEKEIQSVTMPHVKGKKSQGFGLGLSIVTRLCKRYKWELVIDSYKDRGTCVRIHWQ